MIKKKIAAGLLCALVFVMTPCGVWAEELLVGGQAVGIEISSDGVIVSGFSTVETEAGAVSPAEEAGFKPGDLIVEIDGETIRTAEDLIAAVAQLGGNEATVAVLRGSETVRLRVRPALSPGGQWLLGMWLRDGVSGVGTLTFIEPESGLYGALGHSVNDESSGQSVPLREGRICAAEIVGVSPGTPGTPGELSGSSENGTSIGSVEKNTAAGIFGHLAVIPGGRLMQTGQIRTGAASIVSTLSGHETREYAVEVAKKYDLLIVEDTPYKNIRFAGERLPSMYSMDPERVIMLGTFSKTFVPGFRLGWVVAPDNVIRPLHAGFQPAGRGPLPGFRRVRREPEENLRPLQAQERPDDPGLRKVYAGRREMDESGRRSVPLPETPQAV